KIDLKVKTDTAFRIDTNGIGMATIENIGYMKAIVKHGFCWGTTTAPDTNNSKNNLGALSNLASFTGTITGLDLNTTYYVRSYIANETHIAFGKEFILKAVCGGETEISYESQSYKIVPIGNQCWMAKNLNVGTYVESTSSYYPQSNVSNNSFVEKYCYDNNTTNCDNFGGLYDWNEMMHYTQNEGTKGICPNGWHIPSNSEWEQLVQYLGGYSVAGGKLKPLNPHQFDALMGGYRLSNGSFVESGLGIRFWSSSINSEGLPFYRYIADNSNAILNKNYNKSGAFHIRCIKNQ
ncbi:MAG: FISUMP domain-containing protein, partial [Bacteroidales bacterium]|nr:FISUMP domain-containing protein [Bacteroidales bacterium]